MNRWKRKELLALPIRKWDSPSEYDSLLLVPTGKKHDSGWALISIVGVRKGEPVEQAAHCDDIGWQVVAPTDYEHLRMDCLYPAGVMHAWGRGKFVVGASLGSTRVTYRHETSNAPGVWA